jgi:hypothetical protein
MLTIKRVCHFALWGWKMSSSEANCWARSIEGWGLFFLLALLKTLQITQGRFTSNWFEVGGPLLLISAIFWVLAGIVSLCALMRLRGLGLIDDLEPGYFKLSMVFSVPLGMLALLYTLDQMNDRHIIR